MQFDMKNYLHQTLHLVLLILLGLMGLSFVHTDLPLFGLPFRKMDIFADIRKVGTSEIPPATSEILPKDSLTWQPTDTLASYQPDSGLLIQPPRVLVQPVKDSAFFGKKLEDYTENQMGMQRFYQAIDSIPRGRKVRVAWYGDSFVEGDILIADLRDSLQTLWGGEGVGFVPATSEVAQFKRSFKHSFQGFTTFSIVKKTEYRPLLGINGYAYQPSSAARLYYEGANYFRHTHFFGQCRLFYTASQAGFFTCKRTDAAAQSISYKAAPGQVQTWQSSAGTGFKSISLQFPDASGLMLYGASLEGGAGLYIDNFSIRGNTGGPLRLLKPSFVQQFDREQKYDLIVLQVGLNAVTNSLNNIRWYEAELNRTFEHLRLCFPNKPILIVSVGDRATKIDGELATMRSVPAIVSMQRELARKHGFLFFDLFKGMGGHGSIIDLAQHKPRYANLDYTHLTHEGGRYMSRLFVQLFVNEKKRYEQKALQ